ncbi:hypothetical protein [Thermomonospora cellulosilytica]|uniref:Uncharacterized protein n=1 Tax=Thermomonospora cellulosilytica TaxID=1411118 RepID=A0A7W3MXN2_9ACTN|nr:hypothetical protein [Thermomonospora cellulosilytica]MBA9003754.1 hypothetical protein [Thermomonospora cellulosilytica]
MTKSRHYRQAEQLVDQAHHFTYGDGADPVTGAALAAEAQTHAILALVDALTTPTRAAVPDSVLDVLRVIVNDSDVPDTVRTKICNAVGVDLCPDA